MSYGRPAPSPASTGQARRSERLQRLPPAGWGSRFSASAAASALTRRLRRPASVERGRSAGAGFGPPGPLGHKRRGRDGGAGLGVVDAHRQRSSVLLISSLRSSRWRTERDRDLVGKKERNSHRVRRRLVFLSYIITLVPSHKTLFAHRIFIWGGPRKLSLFYLLGTCHSCTAR